jgi:hypothetical protein
MSLSLEEVKKSPEVSVLRGSNQELRLPPGGAYLSTLLVCLDLIWTGYLVVKSTGRGYNQNMKCGSKSKKAV